MPRFSAELGRAKSRAMGPGLLCGSWHAVNQGEGAAKTRIRQGLDEPQRSLRFTALPDA